MLCRRHFTRFSFTGCLYWCRYHASFEDAGSLRTTVNPGPLWEVYASGPAQAQRC